MCPLMLLIQKGLVSGTPKIEKKELGFRPRVKTAEGSLNMNRHFRFSLQHKASLEAPLPWSTESSFHVCFGACGKLLSNSTFTMRGSRSC